MNCESSYKTRDFTSIRLHGNISPCIDFATSYITLSSSYLTLPLLLKNAGSFFNSQLYVNYSNNNKVHCLSTINLVLGSLSNKISVI